VVPIVVGQHPAGAELSAAECGALVEEGAQARADLAKLIEGQQAQQGQTGTTNTTSPQIASYVSGLLTSAQINVFGFVSADAGAPLDVCLPAGTTKLTLFSDPVVLWEGVASFAAFPVTVRIPTSVECGAHTMQATGPGVDQSVQLTVGGACAAPGSGAGGGLLARTGADLGRDVGIAVGLLALGYAVISARRARSASAAGH
jgi:hypothetical protein